MPRICGIGSYLPEKTLTNDDLAKNSSNWSSEKIFRKTGIKVRHIANNDENVSDLAVYAIENLFKKIEFDKNKIDFIFLVTQSQDQCIPSTSFSIHRRIGLNEKCGVFDINQGCTGYIYGLALAKSLISSGEARNILLVTSDTYSKLIDPKDNSVSTLFGDAATASLISFDKEGQQEGIGPISFGTDSSKKDLLSCDFLGLKVNQEDQKYLFMDGPGILNFTLSKIPSSLDNYLEKNKLNIDNFDLFVFHQANKFILEKLYKKIGVADKGVISLSDTGNTVSSSIPLVLEDILKDKEEKKLNILLAGFGVGLSWGFTSVIL